MTVFTEQTVEEMRWGRVRGYKGDRDEEGAIGTADEFYCGIAGKARPAMSSKSNEIVHRSSQGYFAPVLELHHWPPLAPNLDSSGTERMAVTSK